MSITNGSLWGDELYRVVDSISGDLYATMKTATGYAQPGYMLYMLLWTHITGSSEFILRCSNIPFAVIAMIYVYKIVDSKGMSIWWSILFFRDADKDALHPIKKTRPIASGEISKKAAGILAVILASASLITSLYCFGIYKTLYVLVYFILNLAYSLQLKKIALLDICILVSGFIIRTFYGGAIASIDVSNWLYLTILSVSFFFAPGKRCNEIKNHGVSTRDVLSYYTQEFLDKNIYVCIGMTNCFYSLWAMSQNNNLMIISIPIVFVLLMRYSLIIEGGVNSEGDPTEILLKDKTILLLDAIYVMLMFPALYFK